MNIDINSVVAVSPTEEGPGTVTVIQYKMMTRPTAADG